MTGAAAFTGALTAGFEAEGFTAGFDVAAFEDAVLEAAPLEAAPLEAALDSVILETAALGATFAVLWGIALLFLEDATALPVLRVSFDDARDRLFVALRRAAAAFFDAFEDFEAEDFRAKDFEADTFEADNLEGLDALFLRVFWATTNRAEPPRPC